MVSAAGAATAQDIRRYEDERYRAMLAGDAEALEGLLDPALVYTHSSGIADTKASYIEGVRSKIWEYQTIAREDETIVVRGDHALVFNRLRISIHVRGAPKALDNRALAVWSRSDDGAWRLLALHSTPAQQSPP
jgi:ketosteroid isomerase-like protein